MPSMAGSGHAKQTNHLPHIADVARHAGPNEEEYTATMKEIEENGFATGEGAYLA